MKGSVRVLATVLIAVALTAAAVFALILPLQSRASADGAAVEELRAQLVKLERVARRISDLQADVKRLEGALAFFENRLPKEREIDVILREVWRIAESRSPTPANPPRGFLAMVWHMAEAQGAGLTPLSRAVAPPLASDPVEPLKVRSIRTGAAEHTPRYSSQPITMTLEGKFESFYEFLLGLERLPRITKVRQLQITTMPQTDGVIQADLLMDIFFEKEL